MALPINTKKLAFRISQRHMIAAYVSLLDWDLDLLWHSLELLLLVDLYLIGTWKLKNFQGFPGTHFYTNIFVAHKRHKSLKWASSGLSSRGSQEIPGYPQTFQESWKSSSGLTQTHRGRVLMGPGGPRGQGGISTVGPLCGLGVQQGKPVQYWGLSLVPAALSEEELCLLGALPPFQNL